MCLCIFNDVYETVDDIYMYVLCCVLETVRQNKYIK